MRITSLIAATAAMLALQRVTEEPVGKVVRTETTEPDEDRIYRTQVTVVQNTGANDD